MARRRRTSEAEAVLALVIVAIVVLSSIVIAVINEVIYFSTTYPFWAAFLFILIVLGVIIGFRLRKRSKIVKVAERTQKYLAIKDINNLSPAQFEQYVNIVFWLAHPGEKALVRGKYYALGKKSGIKDVRSFASTVASKYGQKGYFVTNSVYTAPAVKFAADTPVTLINGEQLAEMAVVAREAHAQKPAVPELPEIIFARKAWIWTKDKVNIGLRWAGKTIKQISQWYWTTLLRTPWSDGGNRRWIAVGAVLVPLLAFSCFGWTGVLMATGAFRPPVPTATPTPIPPTATETIVPTEMESPTDTPTVTRTRIPQPTNTRRPTFTPGPTYTPRPTQPPRATNTSRPTSPPPTAVPQPTSPPPPPPPSTESPAYSCDSYRACSTFSTCAEVHAFLNACPQYWDKADRDGDGVPCESLCSGG